MEHLKRKMQEWANGAFRKKTDKVVSTDVTYKGKSLDEALKVENLREIKETEEKPAQLEHRDQQDRQELRVHRDLRDCRGHKVRLGKRLKSLRHLLPLMR